MIINENPCAAMNTDRIEETRDTYSVVTQTVQCSKYIIPTEFMGNLGVHNAFTQDAWADYQYPNGDWGSENMVALGACNIATLQKIDGMINHNVMVQNILKYVPNFTDLPIGTQNEVYQLAVLYDFDNVLCDFVERHNTDQVCHYHRIGGILMVSGNSVLDGGSLPNVAKLNKAFPYKWARIHEHIPHKSHNEGNISSAIGCRIFYNEGLNLQRIPLSIFDKYKEIV